MADFGTPPKFEGRPDESLATFQMQVNIQIAARGINVNRRVGFVISCLAGSAQLWAAVRYADGLPDNVDTLFDHLRAEFASESTVMARRIAFENVRQRGTIEDYIDKFRAAALLVGGVGDDEMKTRFIQGLIPRIRSELMYRNPGNFRDACDIARRFDAAHQLSNQFSAQRPNRPLRSHSQPPNNRRSVISPEERERRLRLGLCFRCGERGHLAADCRPDPSNRLPASEHASKYNPNDDTHKTGRL
eukprot:m.236705 g.236705  ORF g.236705 m.236705 type:complete len:246 (+) comp26551_c0_seq5:161-898(+)